MSERKNHLPAILTALAAGYATATLADMSGVLPYDFDQNPEYALNDSVSVIVEDYELNQTEQIEHKPPQIEVHADMQNVMTEMLLENSLLVKPICSKLFIGARYSDVEPDIDSAIIAQEYQASEGQTEVNVSVDTSIELNADGEITVYATTQPKLRQGTGRTNLHLSLSNEAALPRCETAIADMGNEVLRHIESLRSLLDMNQDDISMRISRTDEHPCDTTLTLDNNQESE